MPRIVEPNQNGELVFTEEARDIDGDNIQLDYVKLKAVDGAPPPTETPSWLNYETTQSFDGDTRVRLVTLKVIPGDLEEGKTYTFELSCQDQYSGPVLHEVDLVVGKLLENVSQLVVWDSSVLRRLDLQGNEEFSRDMTVFDDARNVSKDIANDRFIWFDPGGDEIWETDLELSTKNKLGTVSGVSTTNNGFAYDPVTQWLFFQEDGSREIFRCRLDGSNVTGPLTSSGSLANLRADCRVSEGRLYSSGYQRLHSYAIAADGSLSDEVRHYKGSGSGGNDIVRFDIDPGRQLAVCNTNNDGLFKVSIVGSDNARTVIDGNGLGVGCIVDPAEGLAYSTRRDASNNIWLTEYDYVNETFTQILKDPPVQYFGEGIDL